MCKGVVRVPGSISSGGKTSREEIFLSRVLTSSSAVLKGDFLMISMAAPQFVYKLVWDLAN